MTVALAPDVVLMDVPMVGLDGIEATGRLAVGGSCSTRILLATTFDLDRHIYAALRADASSFLLKHVPRIIWWLPCAAWREETCSSRRASPAVLSRPLPAAQPPSSVAQRN